MIGCANKRQLQIKDIIAELYVDSEYNYMLISLIYISFFDASMSAYQPHQILCAFLLIGFSGLESKFHAVSMLTPYSNFIELSWNDGSIR